MMKHSFALLVASVATLAGCDLYFGDGHGHGGDTNWDYCGSDGYYKCDGDNCEWQGPNCPAGVGGSGTTSGGGSSGSGYECTVSTDCAAGCYCANGACTEAGFCTTDADCGTGYVCNTDRSSCEPAPPAPTCKCTSDAEAKAQGYDYCDEWTGTCGTGIDPAGTCGGEVTCNQIAPSCQPGDVPLIGADGCWNGQCEAVAQCAVAPSCTHIQDKDTCDADGSCHEVVNGINCTLSDGSTPCHAGDTGCSCSDYVYASCANN